MKLFALLLVWLPFAALAGRPVLTPISRQELLDRSTFIFTGWPSTAQPVRDCPHEWKRWWVHKVLRGDKGLEGKVIAIAPHHYGFQKWAHPLRPTPSYPAYQYRSGLIDFEQGSSFLFTIRQDDGCFELSAHGAQESRMIAPEIEALFASEGECYPALGGFDFRADQMPQGCTQDGDCALFFEHPDPCHAPYVWSRTAKTQIDADFRLLQKAVRRACAPDWSTRRACEAQQLPFRCYHGRCEAGIAATEVKGSFLKATLFNSSAPNDAPSTEILIGDGKNAYPHITINWWKQGGPQMRPGEYRLATREVERVASYCPAQHLCSALEQVSLRVTIQSQGKVGTVELSAVTLKGEKIEIKVPAEWAK